MSAFEDQTRSLATERLEAEIERLGYLHDDNTRLRAAITETLAALRANPGMRGLWCWLNGDTPDHFFDDHAAQQRVVDALTALEALR